MTYPWISKVNIPNPCQNICSTTTVASIYCRGCNRHWRDVVYWNRMDDAQKIKAMKVASYHRAAKEMGLVDGDNTEYDQESIHSQVERRLRETAPEAGETEGR